MKLHAKARLQALMKFPVRNDSKRGFLVVIANMVIGDRRIGTDCRAAVARYLVHHQTTAGYIVLIGDKDTGGVYHTLLTDLQFNKIEDAYNGVLKDGLYTHRANQEIVSNPVVSAVPVKDFMRHLLNGTFEAWVNQYPN